mgnify:CR=1 FL=1
MEAAEELFDRIVNPELLIRRITITANHVVRESEVQQTISFEQLDLFTDYDALEKQRKEEDAELEKEKKMQQAMLSIKKKFGKNAILKGMNLEEGATAKDRKWKNLDKLKAALEEESFKAELDEIENGDME